ncbi:MAG: HAMP domain-containing sensor histidine kinase [Bacteroidales bacterium]|nr:HAMP domain-containing sensor histidine kinase [Bacteroidales bacterium]
MKLSDISDRYGKVIFLICSVLAVILFLMISTNLVKQLSAQERERMNIWASATEKMAKADTNADFEFLLNIIAQNNSIPVMVTDAEKNILEYRNYKLPDRIDDGEHVAFSDLTEKNRKFLTDKLRKATGSRSLDEVVLSNPHFIKVEVFPGVNQYIFYEDSILLRRLSLYPYVELSVMLVLVLIIYTAVVYTKKAEQNRVWVGLSKETAHQLGTPISSLMAWTEYLEAAGTDREVTTEIDKDVKRLSVIADRFSKIGSRPDLELEYLNQTILSSLEYMSSRISGKVSLNFHFGDDDHGVLISRSLFEWVMENLTKNAVDAMAGAGEIHISTGREKSMVWIEFRDTGKGIPRKNFAKVFSPGYTTKQRGWGLGLTLVKRIVEEYHNGRIFVKESEIGQGTTFRIELPAKLN